MSFKQSVLISVLLSLGLGIGMLVVVLKLIPPETKDAYVVLAVDDSYSDRVIGDLLSPELVSDIGGNTYISESTQWVFLDDFGVLQQIPLDEYDERVETFDPRNDGYAKKLHSFFVRDGKRFFFIPISAESIGTKVKTEWGELSFSDSWLNKQQLKRVEAVFTQSLQDIGGSIPFSIDFFRYEKPLLFYFLLFAIAAVLTLVLSETPLLVAALLPVLGALVFAGPPGLALCAAMIAMLSIFIQPIRQLLIFFQYRHIGQHQQNTFVKPLEYFGSPSPVVLSSVLLGIALIGILGFCGMSGILGFPVPESSASPSGKTLVSLGIAAFLCCACIVWLVLWTESRCGKTQNHIRFMPVSIMMPVNRMVFKRSIVPFVLVSLIAVYVPQMKGGVPDPHNPGLVADISHRIDGDEYEKHVAFQRAFSFIPLGSPPESGKAVLSHAHKDEAYELNVRYVLGEDGLIADTGNQDVPVYSAGNGNASIPPFPLENLIAFFKDFEYNYVQDTTRIDPVTMMGLVPVMLVPGVYIMALFRIKQTHGKKKHILIYDKRIIA